MSNWKKFNIDSLPKNGSQVIIRRESGKMASGMVYPHAQERELYQRGLELMHDDSHPMNIHVGRFMTGAYDDPITHWMPMPEQPED